MRRLLVVPWLAAVAVLTLASSAGRTASPKANGVWAARAAHPGSVVGGYRVPLDGRLDVLRPFAPPVTPYGPGHLGVDLRAARLGVVRAAAPGIVTFAGAVAGRGVVVVLHPDGIRTEYEPLVPAVRRGAQVSAGQRIGVVRGKHRGCPGPCLHWGARRGAVYLDPLRLLTPLGPVVLLP